MLCSFATLIQSPRRKSACPRAQRSLRRGRARSAALPPPPRRTAGSGLAGGLRSAWRSFSGLGLLLGAIFLALSLTPSLIPRSFPLQGALAGVSLAVGYGIGVLFGALWTYLELPVPHDRLRRALTWGSAAVAAVIVVSYSWRAAAWQNSIRRVMDMPPVESARPFEVILVAALVFVLLLLLARLFGWLFRVAQRRAGRYVPVRVSRVSASPRRWCSSRWSSTACCCAAFLRARRLFLQDRRRADRARRRRRRPTRWAPAAAPR